MSAYNYSRSGRSGLGSASGTHTGLSLPPVPSFRPEPHWDGYDFYQAHAVNPDRSLYTRVMDRMGDAPMSEPFQYEDVRMIHDRIYSDSVTLGHVLPSEIGAAAAYEAYRMWKHLSRIFGQSLRMQSDHVRDGLVGLAMAEASRLWQRAGRAADSYGVRDALQSAAMTATKIYQTRTGYSDPSVIPGATPIGVVPSAPPPIEAILTPPSSSSSFESDSRSLPPSTRPSVRRRASSLPSPPEVRSRMIEMLPGADFSSGMGGAGYYPQAYPGPQIPQAAMTQQGQPGGYPQYQTMQMPMQGFQPPTMMSHGPQLMQGGYPTGMYPDRGGEGSDSDDEPEIIREEGDARTTLPYGIQRRGLAHRPYAGAAAAALPRGHPYHFLNIAGNHHGLGGHGEGPMHAPQGMYAGGANAPYGGGNYPQQSGMAYQGMPMGTSQAGGGGGGASQSGSVIIEIPRRWGHRSRHRSRSRHGRHRHRRRARSMEVVSPSEDSGRRGADEGYFVRHGRR